MNVMHPKKPTLLVVDDDTLVLDTLVKLLAHFGFNVISHSDSLMALATLDQRNDIAIMICDYEMPGINGEELARAAKKKFPTMPVFVVSGQYPPDLQPSPWDGWFLKGAPVTELIRKLNTVVPLAAGARRAESPRGKGGESRHDDLASVG
jgi:CheY-like chemotaxis protein